MTLKEFIEKLASEAGKKDEGELEIVIDTGGGYIPVVGVEKKINEEADSGNPIVVIAG